MATVFISQGAGVAPLQVDLLATHGPYRVGRWAARGPAPDRCYFCPLADIRPAVHFVRRGRTRYGYCARHRRKAEAWRP